MLCGLSPRDFFRYMSERLQWSCYPHGPPALPFDRAIFLEPVKNSRQLCLRQPDFGALCKRIHNATYVCGVDPRAALEKFMNRQIARMIKEDRGRNLSVTPRPADLLIVGVD